VSTTYGDNSGWSGTIYEDKLNIGGSPPVSVKLAAITTQTMFFSGNTYEGILGLGPDDILDTGLSSFMDATIAAGVTNQMAFQFCLDKGNMWLGGYDPAAATAAPTYTPMNALTTDEPWYTVDIASVGFGGTKLNFTQKEYGEALVDTGTSVMLVPPTVETAAIAAVNDSAGFKQLFGTQKVSDGGCVTTAGVTSTQVDATLPTMDIAFPGGGSFQLTPTKSYMLPQGNGQFCFVMSSSGSATMSVLGDTVLASFETVFDVAGKRVGFAPQVGCVEGDVADAMRVPTPRTFGPGMPWWHDDPDFHLPHRLPR